MCVLHWLLCLILFISPTLQFEMLCPNSGFESVINIRSWDLKMEVHTPKYDWKRVLTKCNANMTERIEYDLSGTNANKERQQRTISLDTVDTFTFLDMWSDDATIEDYALVVHEGERDLDGNRINSSITIDWIFHIKEPERENDVNTPSTAVTDTTDDLRVVEDGTLATQRVAFYMAYEVVGLLKEDDGDMNYLEWRPFQGNFLADSTTMKNVSVEIVLPWGLSGRDPDMPPGVGYNITTNHPGTIAAWEEEQVTVMLGRECWKPRSDGEFIVDLNMDKRPQFCNQFPPWIYLVMAGASILSVLVGCSIMAFLFFEKPYHVCIARDPNKRLPVGDVDEETAVPYGHTIAAQEEA
eukprot:NODE_1794_length_1212_cov_76.811982_g1779_i0.p1 GENE.NODE_1794_length_1212_cov_76.811982_g1779_i0~~NODE_1794_length_1212_cov_76.811982_g1779_i0.p1  ORF type:complete len:354 (+),score=57.98 NODE_1794_length_1212_cov_76.811982_g1779_i0:117-1178(+)